MNAKTFTSLVSLILAAAPAVCMADEDSTEIDEVVSFASQSDIATTGFDADAIDVSATQISIDLAAISVSAPETPAIAVPVVSTVSTDAEEAE